MGIITSRALPSFQASIQTLRLPTFALPRPLAVANFGTAATLAGVGLQVAGGDSFQKGHKLHPLGWSNRRPPVTLQ